ncbi:hypothetical protein AOLI_G00254230 [Acnodon oligacanthus]
MPHGFRGGPLIWEAALSEAEKEEAGNEVSGENRKARWENCVSSGAIMSEGRATTQTNEMSLFDGRNWVLQTSKLVGAGGSERGHVMGIDQSKRGARDTLPFVQHEPSTPILSASQDLAMATLETQTRPMELPWEPAP